MKVIDIYIRSYEGDYQWLNWLLKSIRAHVTGYRKIVLALQHDSAEFVAKGIEIHKDPQYSSKGRYDQQHSKLLADKRCQGADFICHVDSDCFFHSKVNLQDLLVDGKPVVIREQYRAALARRKEKSDVDYMLSRKALAEEILGVEMEHEYMRAFPFIYPIDVYPKFRSWATRVAGLDSADPSYAQSDYVGWQKLRGNEVADFNLLGYVAAHECDVHVFTIGESETPGYKWGLRQTTPVWQGWSVGGLKPDIVAQYQKWLQEGKEFEPYPYVFPVGAKAANFNEMTLEELVALPGIGEAIAQDIIREREKSPFMSPFEVAMRIDGIGQKAKRKLDRLVEAGDITF